MAIKHCSLLPYPPNSPEASRGRARATQQVGAGGEAASRGGAQHRDRDRDRDRDRQRQTETDSDRQRQTDRQTETSRLEVRHSRTLHELISKFGSLSRGFKSRVQEARRSLLGRRSAGSVIKAHVQETCHSRRLGRVRRRRTEDRTGLSGGRLINKDLLCSASGLATRPLPSEVADAVTERVQAVPCFNLNTISDLESGYSAKSDAAALRTPSSHPRSHVRGPMAGGRAPGI
eukprot:714185-Rhodomonas_salina.2